MNTARLGRAGRGWAGQGKAWQGMDFWNSIRPGLARLGWARRGGAWQGKAGILKHYWAWRGKAWPGRSWQGFEDTHTPYARQRVIRANGDRWGSRKSAANDLLCGFFFGGLLQC